MSEAPASVEETITLPDGSQVQLTQMNASHRDAILTFARSLPEADLLFLSMDITNPKIVDRWLRQIESGRTRSLLAYDGEQAIGYANVHRNPTPWMRRVGEIRVNVAPQFRSRGLGRALIHRAFDMARDMGLKKDHGADDRGSAPGPGCVPQARVRA